MRNASRINKLIKSIKGRSAAQNADIQTALVECALFAFEDRNTDPAIRLFDAVSNGTNRKAMAHWLSLNACIHFKDGKPVLSDKRQKEMQGSMATSDVEAELANAAPWYELATESNKPENIWDGAAKLEGLRKYLAKLDKESKEAGDTGMHDIATKLLAAINAEEYAVVEA